MAKPYRGPVIDPHHHLWNLGMGRHSWLAATAGEKGGLGDLGPIKRDYRPADYALDAARQQVVGTVHIEAGWTPDDPLGETCWLDTLDRAAGTAERYVVHVRLDDERAAAPLDAEAAQIAW